MGFEPNLNPVQRYSRTFNPLEPVFLSSPFFFMTAGVTGVAGDVLAYTATQDTVNLAASGALRHELAGFLMQDVKNLDAGPVKGYRNYQNSVENLGGNVGVMKSNVLAETTRVVGTPAIGTRLATAKDGKGKLEAYNAASNNGDPIAVVEANAGVNSASVEPQQFATATAPTFFRIRIYNL